MIVNFVFWFLFQHDQNMTYFKNCFEVLKHKYIRIYFYLAFMVWMQLFLFLEQEKGWYIGHKFVGHGLLAICFKFFLFLCPG